VPTAPAAPTPYEQRKKIQDHMLGLLRLWKSDRKRLVERFDANADGHVDWQEWERAQAAARDLAEAKFAGMVPVAPQPMPAAVDSAPQGATHKLIRPDDGRPLFVTKGNEKSAASRQRWQSRLGLVAFVGATLYLFTALYRCVGP
jgi:hypothetical protein